MLELPVTPVHKTSDVTFIVSEKYRMAAFGKNHPLAIPRVELVYDLCNALGWWKASAIVESPVASIAQLAVYHDRDYIAALSSADCRGAVTPADRENYGIGTMENPYFPGVLERASLCVGGSIRAAELVRDGGISYHPSGGTHHGRKGRASGFCYFNDPVFALLTLLRQGMSRVAYVDLDAHHGDGVEIAFEHDARVWTVSTHEQGRWPYTGKRTDVGGGRSFNLPVPPGFNDSELHFLMDEAILPFLERAEPQAIVITCGTDPLRGDPLSKLELSNVGLWDAVERLTTLTPSTVVLGGGGYNPWTLARCWTGLWGRLGGFDIPEALPHAVTQRLSKLECDLVDEEDICPDWLTTLADEPNKGAVRDTVRALVAM